MYSESQITRGSDTQSHSSVTFEAVWVHLLGAKDEIEFEAARLLSVWGGDEVGELGAGEEVELRDDLVGEEPTAGGGKSLGCLRVDTILSVDQEALY